jgi:hypothetical protein
MRDLVDRIELLGGNIMEGQQGFCSRIRRKQIGIMRHAGMFTLNDIDLPSFKQCFDLSLKFFGSQKMQFKRSARKGGLEQTRQMRQGASPRQVCGQHMLAEFR